MVYNFLIKITAYALGQNGISAVYSTTNVRIQVMNTHCVSLIMLIKRNLQHHLITNSVTPSYEYYYLFILLYCVLFSVHNRTQSFTLSGNTNNPIQAMVGSTGSVNFCQADYLIIPMAMNVGRPVTGVSANVDRICGGTLSADVSLNPTPIRSKYLVSS